MSFKNKLPYLTIVLFGALTVLTAFVGFEFQTSSAVLVSSAIFLTCLSSAWHLLGARAALSFSLLAIVVGWLAEKIGTSTGWIFGEYEFTGALGPALGAVPVVIPLMWFSVCYVSFVLSNLILRRSPLPGSTKLSVLSAQSFFAATLATAYDLGLDPYMVIVAKAWVMKKADGGWFGETLHGFVGWFAISFLILISFQLLFRRSNLRPAVPFTKRDALIPIFIFASWMTFQIVTGPLIELRVISLFSMGLPLLVALLSFDQWKWDATTGISADPNL